MQTKAQKVAWRLKNAEKVKAQKRASYRRHREAILQRMSERYREKNPIVKRASGPPTPEVKRERERGYKKKAYQQEPHKYRQRVAAWRSANPLASKLTERRSHERPTYRERQKAWQRENPLKMAIYRASSLKVWRKRYPEKAKLKARCDTAKRRAIMAGAGVGYTRADVQTMLEMQGYRCFYCLESLAKGFHVDHLVALARGGSHGAENIVCACPSCNHRKSARPLASFLGLHTARKL
jgi:5-methylcytosine-specific restriction endonuclease McrA